LRLSASLRFFAALLRKVAQSIKVTQRLGGFQMKPIGMKNFDKFQSKNYFLISSGFPELFLWLSASPGFFAALLRKV